MEFLLAFSLVMVGALSLGAIWWAFKRDSDPVSALLRRSYIKDGILHVEGGKLTPDEMQSVKEAWDREYPFRRRAF